MTRLITGLVLLGALFLLLPSGEGTPALSSRTAGSHPYGPDRTRFIDEVLGPEVAFRAGWELHAAPRLPEWKLRYLRRRFGRLRVEDAAPGSYRKLSWQELSLRDFLGNEAFVAGVLRDLARMPPGPEAVAAARERLAGRAGAHLGHLLREYLILHPDQVERVGARVGIRSFRIGTGEQYAALLRGELPLA